jgi:hypothetical protein
MTSHALSTNRDGLIEERSGRHQRTLYPVDTESLSRHVISARRLMVKLPLWDCLRSPSCLSPLLLPVPPLGMHGFAASGHTRT